MESLSGPDGHAAYLGYLGVALGLHRELYGESEYGAFHDSLNDALVRRLQSSPIGLIETYPGEIYPVDNAAVIATIALHAQATGTDVSGIVDPWVRTFRSRYVDAGSGLVYQSVRSDGRPLDSPRGSGTALTVYFLSFADRALSRDLHAALLDGLRVDALGFGLMREYPAGTGGRGDIDSGPIVLGVSVSATGFALAGCRIHRDPECYRSLYSSIVLAGAPVDSDGGRTYVSGGPLSDAIMFAMQTARPRET